MEEKPTKPQKLCVSFNNSLPLHHLIITRSSPEKFKLTKVRWREEGTDVQLCVPAGLNTNKTLSLPMERAQIRLMI